MVVSRPAVVEEENVRAGIIWMLATTFFFVVIDTQAKYLLERYSLVQVLWARFFFHFVLVLPLVLHRISGLPRSKALGLQALRSTLMLITTLLFFLGIQRVPLATASTIMFLSPILVTLLAIPLLGEKVGIRRLTSVAVGFLGALIVIRPGSGFMEIAAGFLLACALCNALYQITTRKLRHIDPPLITLLYTAAGGALVFTLAVPFFWKTPELWDAALMLGIGAAGGAGHLCLIRAFQSAPAAAIVPFAYSNLIWATLFGYLVFGNLPDHWTFIGAAVIAGSGLYIFWREQLAKKRV